MLRVVQVGYGLGRGDCSGCEFLISTINIVTSDKRLAILGVMGPE